MKNSSLLENIPSSLINALTNLELSELDRARELSLAKDECSVASKYLFRAVLYIISGVSSSKVLQFFDNTELAETSEPYLNGAVELESRAKNANVKQRHSTLFRKLCFSIEFAYGFNSIESLSADAINSLWGEIIASTGKSYPEIKRYNTPFRVLSNICAQYNGQNRVDYPDRLNEVRFGASFKKIGMHYGVNLPSSDMVSQYPAWRNLWDEWMSTQALKNAKSIMTSFDHFAAHLIKNKHLDDPGLYLIKRQKPSFWCDLKKVSTKRKHSIFTPIYNFTSWVVDEELFGAGEYIVSQSTLNEIKRYTEYQESSAESNKEVLPTLWLHKCQQILTEDDFKWPKNIRSQSIKWLNSETGKIDRVWCPSVTFSYLLMFELPLRKIQVQQLDSGEGDKERYNPKTQKWEPNNGPHANYWVKLKTRRDSRGAIAKTFNEGKDMAGIYVSTNKTKDIAKGHDETSGYTIPWQNEAVIKIIDDMRRWQEKYNPLSVPTAYRDLPASTFSGTPTALALDQIPSRFYLFRNPGSRHAGAPTSESLLFKFWHLLMAELESRLREEGEDVTIILGHDANGTPCRSFFTPHGLRVTGLTCLSEQGVPIEVLSKIVAGHASILMTLHYVKYSPGHITKVLNLARHKSDMEAQDRFINKINNATFDEAKAFSVANSEEAIEVITNQNEQNIKGSYSGSTIGLCPYNGTACSTGGKELRKSGKRGSVYGAVEGGAGNCPRCRHLVTGSPWLINLWLEGNKKLADAQKMSKHIDSIRAEKDELDKTRFQLIKANKKDEISRDLVNRINQLDADLAIKSHELDSVLMTAHALHNLIEKVKAASALSEQSEEQSSQPVLIATDSNAPHQYKDTSRLEVLDTVIQGGRLWRHVEDTDLERERDCFIDKVLFNSGITPVAFSPLSDDEKRMASDASSSFLLTNLSSVEIKQIEQGYLTLEQLGLSQDIQRSVKQLVPVQGLSSLSEATNTILGVNHDTDS